MLNDENVSVEMSKLESDMNNGRTNGEVEKKKKKKKVHFSDKNETIYYEKDESEHNSYFGVTFNNYNYFECFYSKLYNYNFDEKDGGLESPQCIGEEEDVDATSYFDFQDESHYGKQNESETELEVESEGNGTTKGKNTKDEVKKGMEKETIKKLNLMRKGSGIGIGMNTCIRKNNNNINNNNEIKVSDENVSIFRQSFNEDSSFEVKNIKKALLDAEEKTSNYNKEYFGYEIDPFNMKNELKEGYIDKFGNYIYNEEYENDEIEEAWLKSVDEQDPLSTFSNERLKNKLHKEIYAKYDESCNNTKDFYQTVNIYDALFSLCALLIEKETPLKAMVRYKTDLQACKKILTEYKKQIEQFSSAHPFLMNWLTDKKEQNKESLENIEKKTDVVQSKKNVVQVTIKKKEDLLEESFSDEDKKRTPIDNQQESKSTKEEDTRQKIEEEKVETETGDMHQKETNEDPSEKIIESPNEELNKDQKEETNILQKEKTNETQKEELNENQKEELNENQKEKLNENQKEETNILQKEKTNETHKEELNENQKEELNENQKEELNENQKELNENQKEELNENQKDETDTSRKEKTSESQNKEINETLKRESCESQFEKTCETITSEVMNDTTDNKEEETGVKLSDTTNYMEVVKSDKETNAESKCESIQAIANEDVWREYQQMLGVYQKLELDYKTTERRFNNLIDLTQKLTYEYKNVYFLTKGEFEKLYKKLEEYKENIEIKWQFKWSNDSEDNAYGPYNYTDIYQWISVGYVSAINPIHLRRINKENEVVENIWQMYDAINYLIFVSNENVKKKRKLDEMKMKASNESRTVKNGTESVNVYRSISEDEEEEEEEEEEIVEEFDISNRKRKKKKGLIEISKKKAKLNNRNGNNTKEEEIQKDDEFDDDEDEDDFDDYEF